MSPEGKKNIYIFIDLSKSAALGDVAEQPPSPKSHSLNISELNS